MILFGTLFLVYLFIVIRTLKSGTAIFSLVDAVGLKCPIILLTERKVCNQSIISTRNAKVVVTKKSIGYGAWHAHRYSSSHGLVSSTYQRAEKLLHCVCLQSTTWLQTSLQTSYKEHMVNKMQIKVVRYFRIVGGNIWDQGTGAWLIMMNICHIWNVLMNFTLLHNPISLLGKFKYSLCQK